MNKFQLVTYWKYACKCIQCCELFDDSTLETMKTEKVFNVHTEWEMSPNMSN